MQLVLIRHSISKKDSSIPSSQWRLTIEGRKACGPLAQQLAPFAVTRLIASIEPKAVETASILADRLKIPFEIGVGLHEQEREHAPYFSTQTQFEVKVKEMLAQPDRLIFGQETANQALKRFSDALESAMETYPEDNLAIITHGTVMSLFVAQHNSIRIFDFWRGLKMPDIVVLDLPDFKLISER